MLRRTAAWPWLAARRLGKPFRCSDTGIRILLFHDVPERQWSALDSLIRHITASHTLIGPADCAEMLTDPGAKNLSGTACMLTFDDGFASHLAVAERVLARHEAKAIFFVCPGLMDLPADTQRGAIANNIFAGGMGKDDLRDGMQLIDWEGAARLRELGHEIGAHSMTHPKLATLSGDALASEIRDSGRRIGDRLDSAPSWFAFPFGDIDSISTEALAAIGPDYAFCRSGVRGLNRPGTHRLGILADHVDLSTGAAWRALVADGALDARYRHARTRLAAMADEAEDADATAWP